MDSYHVRTVGVFFSRLAFPLAGVAIDLNPSFCAQGVTFKEIMKGHLVSVNFFHSGFKHKNFP